jgi:tetratricopeptide (TPR) repeat protein
MKKIINKAVILVFTILLASSQIQSQTSDSIQIDSLHQVLELGQVNDSARVKVINEYTRLNGLNLNETHLEYLKEALALAQKNNFEAGIGQTYNHLGWYYFLNSETEEAFKHYYQAIEVFEKLQDEDELMVVYTNLTNAYNATNDFEKALTLNLKAIEIAKNYPDSPNKARYYFYTAKTYDRLQDFDNVEKYFLEARKISENCNFTPGVAMSNGALGQNYSMKSEFDKALPLIQDFLAYNLKTGQKVNIAGSYKSLGECYRDMENYTEAVVYLQKAADAYLEINYDAFLEAIYMNMAQSYEIIQDYENSVTYYEKASEMAEKNNSEERTKAIESLKTEYETEKYKQEKVLAQTNEFLATEKAKRSKQLSYGAVAVAIIILVLLGFIYSKLKVIKQQNIKLDEAYAQLEISKKNELAASNLKAIQSQMNPHFIFNALNSVQDLVLQKEALKSYDYLVVFSHLVRNTLDFSEREFITLREEVKFLETYLSLEKLRFQDDFKYDLIYENCCELDDVSIPSLIIQPFIENAIKHGLLHKDGLKTLSVTFKQEDQIICEIVDNGVGREQSDRIQKRQSGDHNSFSTEAIKKRMHILSEQYDTEAGYEIVDLRDQSGECEGTKVIVKLPYKIMDAVG